MLLRGLLSAVAPGGARARLSILIFHRVLPAPDPLFPGEICVEEFERICSWVKDWFQVLPLHEAVDRLYAGDLPPRAAAITFDDGYADNRTIAAPVLSRHDLPATVFVASGFLDGGVMWNDVIIEAVRRTARQRIDLRGTECPHTGVEVGSLEARRAAIDRLIGWAKYLEPAQRRAFAHELSSRAEVVPPADLMMTSGQVLELHRLGIEIGAHTVTHPILARLGVEEARHEVESGKRSLEALIGEPVRLFAYPNGKPGTDYGPQAVEIVREAGFSAAVSTAWGTCTAASDRFQLPRFTPWDRTRLKFGLRMVRNATLRAAPAARAESVAG